MTKSVLAKNNNYEVERRDIRHSLTETQYRRLVEYLKYGYDCLKVIDSSGKTAEVNVDDLINLLEGKNDIQEIVIERVRLDEATSHHLVIGKQSEAIAETPVSGHLKLVIPTVNETPKVSEKNPPSEQLKISEKGLNFEKKHFSVSSTQTVKRKLEPLVKSKTVSIEKKYQSLVLNKDSSKASKYDSTDVHLTQLRVSKSARDYSDLFFKIKNHHEAFSLGASFAKDLDAGKSSFGIYGDSVSKSKCNTIYALMAFMVYQRGLHVTAVLGDEYQNVKKLITDALESVEVVTGMIAGIKCEHIGDVTLIKEADFSMLGIDEMTNFMNKNKEQRKPVFIDLPNRIKAEGSMGRMLPLYRLIDSFTLVMDSKRASISDVRQDLHFMRCYGFNLKGVVLKES